MMYLICVVLALVLAASLLRLFLLKRELRHLTQSLEQIIQTDTNAQLTTTSLDGDVLAFAEVINNALEESRHNYFERQRTEVALKRAITNISHDLRTPLTSAKGYVQLMGSENLDEQDRIQYAQVVQGRLDTLSELMDALFEFARITEGELEFKPQKVDVSSLLRDLLSEAYPDLGERGFRLEVDIPDQPAYCICDEVYLKRAVQNLIKNVLVHGRDYVHVTLTDGTLEITNAADDLDRLEIDQIFDRFYTFDASRSGKNTGLGLAIAKELITRMGGHISASKESSTLSVRIELPY